MACCVGRGCGEDDVFWAGYFWTPKQPNDDVPDCVRCEQSMVLADNLCFSCRWNVNAEIIKGLAQFEIYLEKWAAFRVWEETR